MVGSSSVQTITIGIPTQWMFTESNLYLLTG